jgi:hypothetical protein
MDAGGGDILDAQARANEGGYTLFSHDMHSGMSAQDTVDHLEALAQSDADLSDMVFFIDTLKKLVKDINKNDARAFYDTLRGLTARGAAVICLAHCNKYVDKETGFPIYEGTGDLESDADEVWLLFATHINEKKELLISSYSKSEVDYCKDRLPGKFLQTWKLNEKDRKVVRMDDWEDTVELKKQMATADEFESHIQVITQFIDKKGEVTQGEIEKWLDKKGVGLDRRRLSTLLESRKGQDWERVRKGRKLLHRPLSDDLDAIGAD